MNQKMFIAVAIGTMIIFSILQSLQIVRGHSDDQLQSITATVDPTILTYAQTARQLLNQTMIEYNVGNSSGAEDLATKAYLENLKM